MPMLKRAVFWLMTVALICAPIGLAEAYLRYVGLGNPILYYVNASYRYAPLPNQSQSRRRGAAVTIDSKGLRNTRDWSDPADAKILFIGDSVTWAGTYIPTRTPSRTASVSVWQRRQIRASSAEMPEPTNTAPTIWPSASATKDFNDETALVVTLIAADTTRGLPDAEGRFFFLQRPPPPFRALWEATTFLTWRFYRYLRPISYRSTDDLRVAARSLQNLFDAIRETQRPGRTVLIVLSPIRPEVGDHESALTKNVRAMLDRSD